MSNENTTVETTIETTNTEANVQQQQTVVVERQIHQDSLLVDVDQLDPTYFKNPRKTMTEDAIHEMQSSLRRLGQIQSILVARIEGHPKLAVVAGYTRTEAAVRNVYTPIINKYNKERNLIPSAEGFLKVSSPEDRAKAREAYPEEFEKELKKDSNKLFVYVDPNLKTKSQARLKSGMENNIRSDMPLSDNLEWIENLITEDGYTQKEVANYMKVSEPSISQMRKVYKLPETLRTLLVTPEEGETFTEDELVKLTETTKMLVDEFERRISFSPRDSKNGSIVIPFSHCRELAGRVVGKKEMTLTRKQVMTLLCLLVGADPKSHKLFDNRPPENYSIFVNRMKSDEEETKKARELVANPEAAAGETPTDHEAEEAGANVADLAADQVSSGKPSEETPVATAADEAADNNADVTLAAAQTAEGEEEDGEGGTDSTIAELVGVDADELEGLDDDGPGEPVIPGAKSTKTQAAPVLATKVKSPDLVLRAAQVYSETAQDLSKETADSRNDVRVAACLLAAAALYEMLGMAEQQKMHEEAADNFCEELEIYIHSLELYANDAGKKKGVKPFSGERPIMSLTPGEEAFDDDDDDGVIPEESELEV